MLTSSGAQAAAAAVNGAHTSEAAVEAESEVIAERLLRELTAEHVGLLATLQDTGDSAVFWSLRATRLPHCGFLNRESCCMLQHSHAGGNSSASILNWCGSEPPLERRQWAKFRVCFT